MNIKLISLVSTFWWSLQTFGLYKVQHKNKSKGFCAIEAKNKGRLTQTERNIHLVIVQLCFITLYRLGCGKVNAKGNGPVFMY